MSSAPREDVVGEIMAMQPNAPVGVAFQHHAAIYFLDRNDPHFAERLALLETSRREGTRVRFTYAVEGQRLTSIEPIR